MIYIRQVIIDLEPFLPQKLAQMIMMMSPQPLHLLRTSQLLQLQKPLQLHSPPFKCQQVLTAMTVTMVAANIHAFILMMQQTTKMLNVNVTNVSS